MRTPHALSYSSFSLGEKNPEEFYIQHLAAKSPPRMPQLPAMAVGSAFDAYAKTALHSALFGPGSDPRYEFCVIFESQVEPQNWDFALRAGKHVFRAYRYCGAYANLLMQLQQSIEPPRFEFKVERVLDGVPFLGKPDCRFVLDLGEGRIHCIYDWKVRGYCSKYGASPTKGYETCLDCFESAKQSRSHGKEHGLYLPKPFRGVTVNAGYMETCSEEYADQLCLYGWLLGETPGDETVVLGIEEIVSKFMGEGNQPQLRYARHRGLCKRDYQLKLLERVKAFWTRITSGHFFTEMSKEDSDKRCALLDEMSTGIVADQTETGAWFNDVTQTPFYKR
jgi:hypothetical protein